MAKIKTADIEKDLAKTREAATQFAQKSAAIDTRLSKAFDPGKMEAVEADIADADFSALNKNSRNFEANIATMIYGLDEVTKAFGAEFKQMSVQTKGEKVMSIFSRRKAEEMRTSRVRSTDIRGSMNELISKSNVIQGLLSEQLAVIVDRLSKTSEAHGRVMQQAIETSHEIETLNARLDEISPRVGEIQGRLDEAVGEERQRIEDEIRVARQDYNEVSTKLQSKTAEQQSLQRYAKQYATYVDSLTKQKAAQETLIAKLRIDTEQRTNLYDALAESLRTSTQQDVAHRIDEVGRETDAQAEELMLQVGSSSQNKIVGMMEAHDAYMRRSEEVARKGQVAHADFERRFAEIVSKVDAGRYAQPEA